MSADQERSFLARAEELADLDDLNDKIITTIGMARAARVDQEALQGLTIAVRALDGDVTALFRAATGRGRPGEFTRDTELLETVEEIGDDLSQMIRALRQLRTQIHEALDRAQADDTAGRRDLAAAEQMFTTYPCKGCHPRRDGAIAAAQATIDDAQIRLQVLNTAIEILLPLKLQDALDGVRRVPEDLHQVYEAVYELVAQDPEAMPRSGDWITGEVTAAGMAAGLLAARAPSNDGQRPQAPVDAAKAERARHAEMVRDAVARGLPLLDDGEVGGLLPPGRRSEAPAGEDELKVINMRDGSPDPFAVVNHDGRILSRHPGPSVAKSEAGQWLGRRGRLLPTDQ